MEEYLFLSLSLYLSLSPDDFSLAVFDTLRVFPKARRDKARSRRSVRLETPLLARDFTCERRFSPSGLRSLRSSGSFRDYLSPYVNS